MVSLVRYRRPKAHSIVVTPIGTVGSHLRLSYYETRAGMQGRANSNQDLGLSTPSSSAVEEEILAE